MEFIAEKEKISILTNFSENKIYLIGVGRVIIKTYKDLLRLKGALLALK